MTDEYHTIYLHSYFSIKYVLATNPNCGENCRKIYLCYEKSDEESLYLTLLEDHDDLMCGPHFLLTEIFQLASIAMKNMANFQNLNQISELQKKKQILFVWLHIYGRSLPPNLNQKIIEVFGFDLSEKDDRIWLESNYQEIMVLKLNPEMDVSLAKPRLVEDSKPIIYFKPNILKFTAMPEYLDEIDWVVPSEYEVEVEPRFYLNFKPSEDYVARYKPPPESFLVRRKNETEIECIFPMEQDEECRSVTKKYLDWIEPSYQIVFSEFDYHTQEIPLDFLTEALQVLVYPGKSYRVDKNIYLADGLYWERNPERGWVCVDSILEEDGVISIRHYERSQKENYRIINELLSTCHYDF